MTRPTWLRLLISVWALWFAAALSDVGPLRSCPRHGDHGVLARASSGSHADAHRAHAPADQPDRSHAACTCLGLCCCVPAVALPNAATTIVATVTATRQVPGCSDGDVSVTRAPHSLPFANGPPYPRSI